MADYSTDELYAKLARADQAGDVEAAKVIAAEIRKKSAPGSSFGQSARTAIEAHPAVAAFRAAPAIADSIRGDAAEEIPSAVGSSAFRDARWNATKDRGLFENMRRESQETGAAMFGTDEELALALANNVPGSKLDRDANGNVVIELASGERVYANQPGLDAQDIVRFAGNAASYLPAARAGRAFQGLLGRAVTTGAGTGVTNALGQKAAGREEIDGGEAAIAAGFGAGAELGAPIVAKVIQALNKSPAQGQARAADILRRDLGVEQPTNGQVQAFARALDEIDAGADPASVLGADEFGFIYTRGQRLPEGPEKFRALSQEERLMQDKGMAGDRLRQVSQDNRQALERAVAERVEAFGGPASPRTPVEALEGVTERVRRMAGDLDTRVGKAYEVAGERKASVSMDAVRAVPQRLREAVRRFPQDPRLTPGTRATLEELQGKIDSVPAGSKGVTLRAIEDQRRVLSASIDAGANPTDKAALRAVKAEYDRWLDDAFESALITGDESALAAMKEARGLRTEFGRRFEGNADVDKFIQQMIAGDKTPDELVSAALGASQVSKASAARFVERLKVATQNDPEVVGALRAAHLMKLTHGKNGEMLGMQAIRSNILDAERNTPSVLRSLYEPEQWAQLKRLAQSIEPMVPRGDFARTSGTGERIMRMLQSLPFIGRGVEWVNTPVRVAQADAAVSRLAPIPSGPALVPATAAAASTNR